MTRQRFTRAKVKLHFIQLVAAGFRATTLWILTAFIFGLSVAFAHAAVRTVINTDDSGPGSLRQALLASASYGDSINFQSDLVGPIVVTSPLIVSQSLVVYGPAPDISGGDTVGVFEISGFDVTLENLRIRSGNAAAGAGGAILNSGGKLTVRGCTLTGNTANHGGAIFNTAEGLLIVDKSSISENTAAFASAIYNHVGNTLVVDSTISDHPGTSIVGEFGGISVQNSTLSSTVANTGGIYGFPNITASIRNSTIRVNGVGVYNADGAVSLINSIVAANTGSVTSDIYNSAQGTLSSQFSLIRSLGENTSHIIGVNGNLTGVEPLLGPLQNNGGPTLTHALLPGSPAINAGNNTVAPLSLNDQRGDGFPRIVDGTVDIGAVESQSNQDPAVTCFQTETIFCAPGTGQIVELTVLVTDTDEDTITVVLKDGDTAIASENVAGPLTDAEVTFTVTLFPGAHELSVEVSDGIAANGCGPVTVTVVQDTKAPSITCPANQVENATKPSGVIVNYPNVTASDDCSLPTISYSQDSGTQFPIGSTTVIATAQDAAGNLTPCSFTVYVKGAAEQLTDLVAKVHALPDSSAGKGKTADYRSVLLTQLRRAQQAVSKAEHADACAELQKFLDSVQEFKAFISSKDVAGLTTDASRIRGVIGCSK